MVEYADYAYYKENAHGNAIPEEEFPKAALKASVFIKCITHGRVSDSFESDYPQFTDEIKLAACAAAEVFYETDKRLREHGGREVQSENNDGYSVTYANIQESGESPGEQRAMQAVRPYLIDTDLLYCGVM